MKDNAIRLGLSFTCMTCLLISAGMGFAEPEPTAVVVDSETGEPVEGAIAFAVWWKMRAIGIVEAGLEPFATRTEETLSDSKGRIFINDFWNWHLFQSNYPVLSVYKCGYVIWNQKKRIYGYNVPSNSFKVELRASFKFTGKSMEKLKKEGAAETINQLKTLQNQEFKNSDDFRDALEKTMGKKVSDPDIISILPFAEFQDDFNKKNRIVQLEKWPPNFSFAGHDSFMFNGVGKSFPYFNANLFLKAYDECEGKKR